MTSVNPVDSTQGNVDTVYVLTYWFPLLLVTAGSALHALWNALVKRHGDPDPMFVWVYSAVALPMFVGLLIWAGAARPHIDTDWGTTMWTAMVSTCLHTIYAVVLQRAYARADMTIVYPVARGLAPAMVTAVACAWVGAPGILEITGLALVLTGTAIVGRWRPGRATAGASQGVLIAVCTASYTLWDACAVGLLGADVAGYVAFAGAAQAALMTAALWRRRLHFTRALASSWRSAAPIAVLAPASYGLVLLALRDAPPGVVASARTLTIVFGSVLGVWLLRERPAPATWGGLVIICAGAMAAAG